MADRAEERKTTEIRLDLDDVSESSSSDDWAAALREMESGATKAKPRPAAPAKPAAPVAQKAPESPEEYVALALDQIADARGALQGFIKAHPYLVAPNFHKLWDDSLKETCFTMERQREALMGRRGRS